MNVMKVVTKALLDEYTMSAARPSVKFFVVSYFATVAFVSTVSSAAALATGQWPAALFVMTAFTTILSVAWVVAYFVERGFWHRRLRLAEPLN